MNLRELNPASQGRDAPKATAGGLLHFRTSAIHGQGGFAQGDIPAGERLLEYVGEKIDKAESLRRCAENNEYIFYLDPKFDLDGKVDWNPARLLNHSCAPNSEALMLDGRLWIVSQRLIRAGEEITFNYGYDLTEYLDHPCACGSPGCVGYIVAEEFFPKLRRAASCLLSPTCVGPVPQASVALGAIVVRIVIAIEHEQGSPVNIHVVGL